MYEKWYSWPLGLIAVSLYGFSCYQYEIFGEMFLQVVYGLIAVYGWISWKNNNTSTLSIKRLSIKESVFYFIIALSLSILSYLILKSLDSQLPHLDAITNGFAITATYLAARKKIDNWVYWVPINILTVYIMYLKAMPFYAILYILYGLFAIYGFYQWRKKLQSTKELAT